MSCRIRNICFKITQNFLPLFRSGTYTFQSSTKKEKTSVILSIFPLPHHLLKKFRSRERRLSRVNPFIQRQEIFFGSPTSWTLFLLYVHRGNFSRFPRDDHRPRKAAILVTPFSFVHHHPSNSHSNNAVEPASQQAHHFTFPVAESRKKKSPSARRKSCQEGKELNKKLAVGVSSSSK